MTCEVQTKEGVCSQPPHARPPPWRWYHAVRPTEAVRKAGPRLLNGAVGPGGGREPSGGAGPRSSASLPSGPWVWRMSQVQASLHPCPVPKADPSPYCPVWSPFPPRPPNTPERTTTPRPSASPSSPYSSPYSDHRTQGLLRQAESWAPLRPAEPKSASEQDHRGLVWAPGTLRSPEPTHST